MKKILLPWIITAAFLVAFFWLLSVVDPQHQHHAYPATVLAAAHV